MHASVEAYYALDTQSQFHILQRMFKQVDVQNALTNAMNGIACSEPPTIETQQGEIHGAV